MLIMLSIGQRSRLKVFNNIIRASKTSLFTVCCCAACFSAPFCHPFIVIRLSFDALHLFTKSRLPKRLGNIQDGDQDDWTILAALFQFRCLPACTLQAHPSWSKIILCSRIYKKLREFFITCSYYIKTGISPGCSEDDAKIPKTVRTTHRYLVLIIDRN